MIATTTTEPNKVELVRKNDDDGVEVKKQPVTMTAEIKQTSASTMVGKRRKRPAYLQGSFLNDILEKRAKTLGLGYTRIRDD